MLLSKQKKPETGETFYSYEHSPRDGAPPSPDESLGGMVIPSQWLFVFADRAEMGWRWCHCSGHAELYVEGATDVVERGEDGASVVLLARLGERFGAEVAAEARRILSDPAAFGP